MELKSFCFSLGQFYLTNDHTAKYIGQRIIKLKEQFPNHVTYEKAVFVQLTEPILEKIVKWNNPTDPEYDEKFWINFKAVAVMNRDKLLFATDKNLYPNLIDLGKTMVVAATAELNANGFSEQMVTVGLDAAKKYVAELQQITKN
jgi:hypothetical protein